MIEDLPSPKETKRERVPDKDRDEGPSRKKRSRLFNLHPSLLVNFSGEEPVLEDLFRKTKAEPFIYYLPLSDEEVSRLVFYRFCKLLFLGCSKTSSKSY